MKAELCHHATVIHPRKVRANIRTSKLEPFTSRSSWDPLLRRNHNPLTTQRFSMRMGKKQHKSIRRAKKTLLEKCTSSSLPCTGQPAGKEHRMQFTATKNAHGKSKTMAQDGLPPDRAASRALLMQFHFYFPTVLWCRG